MKERLIFFLKYYLFWVLFFVVQKPVFMVWQYRLLGDVKIVDWILVPWHGLPLDLSVSAYITAVIGLLICISFWTKWDIWQRVTDGITMVLLFVALWVMLGDNGCFPSWGYHINKDMFAYLASPQEALASAPWWKWLLGCAGFVLLFMIWRAIYKRYFFYDAQRINAADLYRAPWKKRMIQMMEMLLLTALLFLPMRGSVTVSTMNTGRVYYSDNQMLNIAAINPVFNIVETLSEDHFSMDRYQYMSQEEAQSITDQLYGRHLAPHYTDSLFTTTRPNIVLVILESFSQNAIKAGAMSHLKAIASEGISFTNTYAASYRTDRGVMAVLGGFPGCATSSLMMVPEKSGQLPQIGQILQKEGYQLKFFYGGDEDFTNMRSYLITGGFEQRVADRDFRLADRFAKWGAPDHVVFQRAANEIVHRPDTCQPTLDVLLSLSSHEPFNVPFHQFKQEYLNAIAYTDSCLNGLIQTLRQSSKWDNTLVVLVADHGYPYPEELSCFDPLHYRIPMVMTGGVVRQPMEVSKVCQQVDWIPTVLHQMHLDASAFPYAKDIMDDRIAPFAYYNFVDGFALVKEDGVTIVDAKVNQTVVGEDDTTEAHEARAITQSIMQTIYDL